MGQAKRRNALHPEKLGGLDAAVPGDDLVIITDQDWVSESELSDAVGDLSDLLLAVGAGVSWIRSQTCDRHRFNGHRFRRLSIIVFRLFERHLPTSRDVQST